MRPRIAKRKNSQHALGEHSKLHQIIAAQPSPTETPNRERRPVDRDWRQGRVDAAAVGQTSVDHRRTLVNPATDSSCDAADDPHQVFVDLESEPRSLPVCPKRSTNTVYGPLTRMSVTAGSANSGAKRSDADRFLDQVIDQLPTFEIVQRPILAVECIGNVTP